MTNVPVEAKRESEFRCCREIRFPGSDRTSPNPTICVCLNPARPTGHLRGPQYMQLTPEQIIYNEVFFANAETVGEKRTRPVNGQTWSPLICHTVA